MSFNALGKIVWDRKLVFLTVFILIVAGVTAFTMTVTPMYQSEALLMTTLDRAQRQQSQFPDTLRYQLNSQIYIINSEDVLRQAIGEYGAQRLFPEQKRPAAWQSLIPPELSAKITEITAPFQRKQTEDTRTDADRALTKVKKRLAVALEKDSQILSLTFRHEDPKVAEQFLTLVVRDFLQRQADLSGNAAAPAFFRKQASRYLDEYKRASAELSTFASQHSTYSVSQETELALARRDSATAALAKTRGAIAEKEAQAATFQNTLTQLRRRISLPSEITGPKQNVPAGNSDALTDANKVPANESPLLLVRVFQDTAQSLVNLNSEIVGLRSLEKAQTEAVADVGRKLSELSSISAEFNRLKEQLDQVSKVMEAHVGRAAEAQLNADWDASEKLSNVKVAQSATSPTEPVFPPKPLFLALGGIIGLVGGAATCVMLEALRVRRRRPQERRFYAEENEPFDNDAGEEQGNWSPSPAMADYRLRRQAPLA